MTMLKSFDLKGNKQSFANWISNLSPCETPFISMIPKEKVDQVQYSWQTDRLSQAGKSAGATDTDADTALGTILEGGAAVPYRVRSTVVHTNFTKIFRKAVRVSDTTKQIALWGRNSELAYQMEKAGLEIKRDVEHYILNSTATGAVGTNSVASECDGFINLVAKKDEADKDTTAVVHFEVAGTTVHSFDKDDIFKMTYNLYLAGSRANKIMVHPQYMHIFSDLIGQVKEGAGSVTAKTPHLHRMFEGLDTKYNSYVKTLRDPLGQTFEIIPNRYMPKTKVFFFNENDWTQMILRAPEKTELGRTGATQKFMIEMEVGLRHRNPFASGILTLKTSRDGVAPVAEIVEEVVEEVVEKPKRGKAK